MEAEEIAFSASCLVNACLPYRNPKPEPLQNGVWVRTNVGYSLWCRGPRGLPYGSYPRLFTIWATTMAIQTQSRDLNAGRSFRDFCRTLGIDESMGKRGGRARLANQIDRLLSSRLAFRRDTLTASRNGATQTVRKTEFLDIAEGYEEFWQPQQNPDQLALYEWHILLGQRFFDEITEHYVLLDMRAVHELKSKPLALDLYQWLAYRNHNMSGPTALPTWRQLAFQFGGQYGRVRAFKEKLVEALAQVYAVYPGLKAEPQERGLLLRKSPTPVPQTRIFLSKPK